MKTLMVAACTFWLALSGCGPVTYDYSKEPDPRKREFVIGVSDSLRINVWKNPELSTDGKVRLDGTITMPLIGDLKADGKTPTELKNEITRRLAAYVKDEGAAVSIQVVEVNSYRFSIGGNVEHGGVFAPKHFVSVSEAISMAGGLNRFATPRGLVVIRNDKNGMRRIPIDYNRVAGGEHPEENLVLIAGDTLFVP